MHNVSQSCNILQEEITTSKESNTYKLLQLMKIFNRIPLAYPYALRNVLNMCPK